MSYHNVEEIWRAEVLYLHSLWHQGPPSNRQHRNPMLIPTPRPTFTPAPTPMPMPKPCNPIPLSSSSIQITKKKRKKKKKKNTINPAQQPVSDLPWPVLPEPQPQTGWPSPVSNSNTRPASVEELAKFAAFEAQQKALKACEQFFENDEEDRMDDDKEMDDEFFLKIFTQDNVLRDYYENNWENGEFCCMVCWGNKQKISKRFTGCAALAQHSTWISNAKGVKSHRAFAKIICKVLGWDTSRLPTIVLSIDGPLSRILMPSDSKVDSNEKNVKIVIDEGGQQGKSSDSKVADANDQNKEDESSGQEGESSEEVESIEEVESSDSEEADAKDWNKDSGA